MLSWLAYVKSTNCTERGQCSRMRSPTNLFSTWALNCHLVVSKIALRQTHNQELIKESKRADGTVV